MGIIQFILILLLSFIEFSSQTMNFYVNQRIQEYKYRYFQIMDGQVIIQQPENYKMYQLDEKFKIRGWDSIQFALQSSFHFHTPKSDQCVFKKQENYVQFEALLLGKGRALEVGEKGRIRENLFLSCLSLILLYIIIALFIAFEILCQIEQKILTFNKCIVLFLLRFLRVLSQKNIKLMEKILINLKTL